MSKYEILLLPLHAMAENFGLVSKSLMPKLGGKSYFTAEGKVALMFLKMYRISVSFVRAFTRLRS